MFFWKKKSLNPKAQAESLFVQSERLPAERILADAQTIDFDLDEQAIVQQLDPRNRLVSDEPLVEPLPLDVDLDEPETVVELPEEDDKAPIVQDEIMFNVVPHWKEESAAQFLPEDPPAEWVVVSQPPSVESVMQSAEATPEYTSGEDLMYTSKTDYPHELTQEDVPPPHVSIVNEDALPEEILLLPPDLQQQSEREVVFENFLHGMLEEQKAASENLETEWVKAELTQSTDNQSPPRVGLPQIFPNPIPVLSEPVAMDEPQAEENPKAAFETLVMQEEDQSLSEEQLDQPIEWQKPVLYVVEEDESTDLQEDLPQAPLGDNAEALQSDTSKATDEVTAGVLIPFPERLLETYWEYDAPLADNIESLPLLVPVPPSSNSSKSVLALNTAPDFFMPVKHLVSATVKPQAVVKIVSLVEQAQMLNISPQPQQEEVIEGSSPALWMESLPDLEPQMALQVSTLPKEFALQEPTDTDDDVTHAWRNITPWTIEPDPITADLDLSELPFVSLEAESAPDETQIILPQVNSPEPIIPEFTFDFDEVELLSGSDGLASESLWPTIEPHEQSIGNNAVADVPLETERVHAIFDSALAPSEREPSHGVESETQTPFSAFDFHSRPSTIDSTASLSLRLLNAEDDSLQIEAFINLQAPNILLLVQLEGHYALMIDNSYDALLLKSFDANPLLGNNTFAATCQANLPHKQLYLIQVGHWQGLLSVEGPDVSIKAEL